MNTSVDVELVETDTHLLTQKAAMTKQDLLSLCHYYRGEVKCPFDSETERPQGLFWMFEELFVRHSLNDPTFIEYYKQVVARYIRESSWHLERPYQRPLSDRNQGNHHVQRGHAAEVGTL